MKIAFFLGAGASVCAGLPTTKTLMNGMFVKHQNCVFGPILTKYEGDDIEDLYGDIKSLLGLKSNKVLAELPAACAGERVLKVALDSEENESNMQRDCKEHALLGTSDSDPSLFEEVFGQLKALQLAVRDHMFNTIRIDPKRFAEYEKMFVQLREFAGDEHMTVVTTNYDMLVEEYCSNNDIKVVDGFTRGPHSLRGTWLGQFNTDCYHIKLVKLHGSLNWRKNSDGEIICENAVVSHDSIQDVFVAPTPTEKNRTNAPFNELLAQFNVILRNLDLLVVIGFSFRDKTLCEMIKKKADDGMRVICVSKTLDPWPESFCKQLYVKNDYVVGMEKRKRRKKHSKMYVFESEFGLGQMDDIMKVLEYVKPHTPASTT